MEHPLIRLRNNQKFETPAVVKEDFTPYFDENCPAERYHADKSSMSSSALRELLKSPLNFLNVCAGLDGNDPEDESDHFRFGRILHSAILEPKEFMSKVVLMPDFGNMRTKQAKEEKKFWLEQQSKDAMVLSSEEHDNLIGMVASASNHPDSKALLIKGKPEVSGWFIDSETKVKCRIRPDYLTPDPEDPTKLWVVDLKSTRDASIGLFAKDMAMYKYHVQLAFYAMGVTAITGRPIGGAAIIAIEKTEPYETCTYYMTDEDLELGMSWVRHGLSLYKKCIDLNQWPSKQSSASMIQLPRWAKEDALPNFEFQEGK